MRGADKTRPFDGKTTQQVWSRVYVDALVARDRDTDANGSLDERVYVLQDANFDVTALVDTSGTVFERFTYDRYGTFAVLDANWSADADGLTDVAWSFYFQGFRFDIFGGGYDVRHRYYVAILGRPLQVDPIGYPDGMSRYEWERSNSANGLDPSGATYNFNSTPSKVVRRGAPPRNQRVFQGAGGLMRRGGQWDSRWYFFAFAEISPTSPIVASSTSRGA